MSRQNTPLDDYEHYRGRLQETLDQLVRVDDAIQDLLEDREYTVDVETCEYINQASNFKGQPGDWKKASLVCREH